jgi:manganese/zinc/iron transport system permease protein
MESLWSYFTDPVLRAPTIGCMLMCLSAALIGVIVYLRKESLLGEALSHASYPGVILGAVFAAIWMPDDGTHLASSFFTVAGAFLFALLGNYAIHFLETRWKIRSDSALCFVLSVFFGLGILLASHIQFSYASVYKQSLSYLYGQAATMNDKHILLYGIISLLVATMISLFYKELKVLTFDRDYAKSIGVRVTLIDTFILVFLSLSIVVGIRSVGVVLMSAMLIAPAVSARQYTHRLSYMLLLAGIFGLSSGFLGNVFSVELSDHYHAIFPTERFSIPTGPMIVMIASAICILSLLFAPERGLCVRLIRIAYFRSRCLRENLLKSMWRQGKDRLYSINDIRHTQEISKCYIFILLTLLTYQGWIKRTGSKYSLTPDGIHRASRLVRLHRLWEVYLCDYLGVGAERVHKSAEEIEHILTPELEGELIALLKDPKIDPHHQPIPPFEGAL